MSRIDLRRVLVPVAAAGAVALSAPRDAAAEGERTPMVGGGVVATSDPASDGDLVGIELEGAWWWGRLGLAVEGSRRWDVATGDPLATTLGASARLLVHHHLLPSLFDPRDVELGVELQGIVEHTWWDDDMDPDGRSVAYGVGIAVRLRGGSDAEFSTLLAESRLFVRVMTARDGDSAIARTATPTEPTARDRAILIGIGAAWGSGERRYVDRFRLRFGEPDR